MHLHININIDINITCTLSRLHSLSKHQRTLKGGQAFFFAIAIAVAYNVFGLYYARINTIY